MIIPQANRLNTVKEYYFSKKLEEIRKMNQEGMEVINLGIGNPDLMPSDTTIAELCKSAQQAENHGYQSYRGVPSFRQAIADWYKKVYHVTLNGGSEILPLIGSKEGIMHISMAFLNEGDEVLVPDPGYPTYASVSKLVGAKVIPYGLLESNDWNIDIEQLERMDLGKVKLMWLNFPHMPTGARGDAETFGKLIQLAKTNGFLIVNDNPYSLILNDQPQSLLSIPEAKAVLIELNSLSKSHNMAGWRLGWIGGDAAYINTVLKAKSNVDSGMFLPIQHAAIQALNNAREWHDAQNKIYEQRRAASWRLLDLLNCKYNKAQTGLFVWAKIPNSQKEVQSFVDNILYNSKVFITPGFIFGRNGERFIRISLCNKVQTVEEAIARIEKQIKTNQVKSL